MLAPEPVFTQSNCAKLSTCCADESTRSIPRLLTGALPSAAWTFGLPSSQLDSAATPGSAIATAPLPLAASSALASPSFIAARALERARAARIGLGGRAGVDRWSPSWRAVA